jgi:hypothetical protein
LEKEKKQKVTSDFITFCGRRILLICQLPMELKIRGDAAGTTSPRRGCYVGTQLRLRRHVFLSISPCCWTRHETPFALRQIKPVNSKENGNHDDAYCHFNHAGGYLFQNKQAYHQDY